MTLLDHIVNIVVGSIIVASALTLGRWVIGRLRKWFRSCPQIWYDAEYDMWFEGKFMRREEDDE